MNMNALNAQTKILVIGAGAMGAGIAQVAAQAGHPVYLYDTRTDAIERGIAGIAADLARAVEKGKLDDAGRQTVLDRLRPLTDLAGAADAGLAIEAIVENIDVKQTLFKQLEALLPADAILASNTSSLSITAMGAALDRPERLAGLHFFNPAPRMKLVEIVSGLATSADIADTLYNTAKAWGKVPVRARSTPGFIVNRVARPFYGEALRLLGECAARPATIDAALRDCGGFPMGPFELMDLIGHDVNFAVTRSVFDATFGDRRYTPSLIQGELVAAGRLGRKSGRGFYDYAKGAAMPAPHTEEAQPGESTVTVVGDLGIAAPLIQRLESAGIDVRRTAGRGVTAGAGRGWIEIGEARLALSDGRAAYRRAAEDGVSNLVLFDLCLDYATATRLVLARADDCGRGAWGSVTGTLQRAGMAVSRIDDVAGMAVLRTVAMLANEGADAVLAGIATAADVDTAMRFGTNYPKGPLAWADELGIGFVATVLANLRVHYGEERYRISPLIQRKSLVGGAFHE